MMLRTIALNTANVRAGLLQFRCNRNVSHCLQKRRIGEHRPRVVARSVSAIICNCWTGRAVRFDRTSVVRSARISHRCLNDLGSQRNSGWTSWSTSANGSDRASGSQVRWNPPPMPEAKTERSAFHPLDSRSRRFPRAERRQPGFAQKRTR